MFPEHVSQLLHRPRKKKFAPKINTPSRLIKKQDLWGGDELTGNRKPSLLPAGYALADGCANNGGSLILQSERKQELVNAPPSLMTWDRA